MTNGKVFLTDRLQREATGLLLGLLGFWLNGFPLQVWNGVDVLPGPVLTYLSIGLLGTRISLIQATISNARTLMIWQHPWGLFLGICEALVVGLLRSRKIPLAASALLFWLVMGLPLVVVIYRWHLGLSWPFAGLTFICDFLCSLIAGGIVQLLLASDLTAKLSERLAANRQPASLRADAFAAFLVAATVPLSGWLAFSGNRLREKSESRAKAELVLQAVLVRDCIDYRVGLLKASANHPAVDQADRIALIRAAMSNVEFVQGRSHLSEEIDDRMVISSSEDRGPWIRFPLRETCGPRITIGDVKIAVLDRNGMLMNQYILQEVSTGSTWFLPSEELLRAIGRESNGSFEFLREGKDPFRRPRYLAGTARLAGGGRVISYHPASGVDPSNVAFQQLTISWIGAVAVLAVLFALWFGRRLMSPLRSLRMHLEGSELGNVIWQNVSRVPEELQPVWASVNQLQLRIRHETTRAEELITEVRRNNEQKSHFLATVSHEVRTPLNAILGMILQVKRGRLTPAQTTAISRIEQASEHLLSVLNEILNFSKIERGAIELNIDQVDIVAVVEGALLIMERQAFDKSLELTWAFDARVPRCMNADAVRLRQILFNLVTNAIKFTDTGTIRITVQKSDLLPNGIRLKVIDTGHGIGPEKLSKIYQPFAQLSHTVGSEPNSGAGLGLSIVKRLVEAMGGTIEIQSYLGKGTTVTVDLPGSIVEETGKTRDISRALVIGTGSTAQQQLCNHLKHLEYDVEIRDGAPMSIEPGTTVFVDLTYLQRHQTQIQTYEQTGVRVIGYETREDGQVPAACEVITWPPSIKSIEQLLSSGGAAASVEETSSRFAEEHPLRILVAEDSPLNREVVQLLLAEQGYFPLIVNDGETAWAMLKAFEFDVALLDLRMPGIDGLELARRCKNELRRPPMLCAVTASAFATDRALALEAKFDAFLTKPLRLHELSSVLASCGRRNPGVWNEQTLMKFLDLMEPAGPAKAQAVLDACWRWGEDNADRSGDEFREKVHSLKGSASLIGATLLVEYFEDIEKSLMGSAAETPEGMPVADLRKSVEREFQRILLCWRKF